MFKQHSFNPGKEGKSDPHCNVTNCEDIVLSKIRQPEKVIHRSIPVHRALSTVFLRETESGMKAARGRKKGTMGSCLMISILQVKKKKKSLAIRAGEMIQL